MAKMSRVSVTKPIPIKTISTSQNKAADGILEKLRQRVEQIEYGSLICEIQVHQGRIKQIDITAVKERMRAD